MVLMIQGLAALIGALRSGFVVLALLLGALCALAWGVRSRRIQPFGLLGKLSRTLAEPVIAPAERRLVRFGIAGVRAPAWAFVFYLLFGLALLALLSFLHDVLRSLYFATDRGSGGVLRLAVGWTFGVLQVALLVRVVMSWVGGLYSRTGRLVVGLTEWMIAPIRRVLPTFGGIDASPIVAWLLLGVLQTIVFSQLR